MNEETRISLIVFGIVGLLFFLPNIVMLIRRIFNKNKEDEK